LERRSAQWQAVSESTIKDFPQLSDEQLRFLTCGVYQLKLSASYMQEHIDGESDIHIFREDSNLLRVKIQSRHTSSKKYILWIRYSPTDVCAWYCTCRAGARVVGMCSHIAAVVWYLSQARDRASSSLGVRDWGEYLVDARALPESVDSSQSDSQSSTMEE